MGTIGEGYGFGNVCSVVDRSGWALYSAVPAFGGKDTVDGCVGIIVGVEGFTTARSGCKGRKEF